MSSLSKTPTHGTPATDIKTLNHLDPMTLEGKAHNPLPPRSAMNWPRKIFHMIGIGTVGMTLALCSLTALQAFSIIAVIATLLVGFDLIRLRSPKLNEKTFKDFRFIMRDYERNRICGITWFMLGLFATTAMFNPKIAGLACLALAFGDPWASYFGIRFGRNRMFGSRKTWEGFVGGMAVVSIVSAIYLGLFGLIAGPALFLGAGLVGLSAAIAESISFKKVDDNLTIPLLVAPAVFGVVTLLG